MIVFEDVSVLYRGVPALDCVSLKIQDGALGVLVGPSGSGKSTLIRLVNRLVEPDRGRVIVRGVDVATLDPPELRRSIGYVIQSVGLFPHRTVAQNIAIVPRLLDWPRARIDAQVDAMLELVRLDGSFRHRYPNELSGGQAQRVGLARALAAEPDILLMDEPFGAVDPITRRELQGELTRIHRETGKTILLVTHDPREALELATLIVVLRAGRVVAASRPEALSHEPEGFARDLFGADTLVLDRLRRRHVGAFAAGEARPDDPAISTEALLSEALLCMMETGQDRLRVVNSEGRAVGGLTFRAILETSS
jgi:osmoprotectant transport system ATP-binding protein